MAIIAKAILLLAKGLLRRFDQAGADPVGAQLRVLGQLLRRGADTRWGRQMGLGDIRTPEQFAQRVPVTPYAQAAPLWHQAFAGERDLTWPGHVDFFALSSGTTAGNKLLPVTADAIRSNLRAGRLLAAMLARRGRPENLLAGKFLYLGGATSLRRRGASLIGDASGIIGRRIPALFRGRRLPEPDIAAITDWEVKIGRIVDRYLTADVRTLAACPSWAALLFKQMIARAESNGPGGPGRKTIGQIWPQLSHFVSYGMAFEPYRPAFEEYIGRPIHYVDTYSSSEAGMTAIADQAVLQPPSGAVIGEPQPAPLRMIVDNGVFFEFVPADQADGLNPLGPPRLHLGQVREGRDYAVVVTTNGGIWAYPLGDVVRFVSLRPPRIVFVGRSQIMLSAFGEHVTLEMMENAMAAACRLGRKSDPGFTQKPVNYPGQEGQAAGGVGWRTGAIVADYTVAPRFPSAINPRPAHRWIVEFDRPPADPQAFIAAIDASIRAVNEDYDTHRAGDFGLGCPQLLAVAPGTFYAWMKRKGKLGGQNKVPRVARSPEMADELLAISAGLAAQ